MICVYAVGCKPPPRPESNISDLTWEERDGPDALYINADFPFFPGRVTAYFELAFNTSSGTFRYKCPTKMIYDLHLTDKGYRVMLSPRKDLVGGDNWEVYELTFADIRSIDVYLEGGVKHGTWRFPSDSIQYIPLIPEQ